MRRATRWGRAVGPTPERTLAVRGLVASVVAVMVAVFLVARGAGVLDPGATVAVELPPEAGRVPVNAPVHHLGVKVGDVRSSVGVLMGDDDEPGTAVEMLIAPEHSERIPSDVQVRVVPRTLFGDVRLDLVNSALVNSDLAGTGVPTAATPPAATQPATTRSAATLSDGEILLADRSEDAVLLYDVFTRASDLLVSIKPDRLQVTLTALDRALDGRGETLGRSIDDADRAGQDLTPALEETAEASAGIAYLAEDLAAASPEILETVQEATRLSQTVLDRPDSLGRLLDAGLAATGSGANMAEETVDGAIRLVDDTGVVFDRTARNPHGVIRTLYAMGPMGRAGAEVFSTGRFNITAVPSFADPMPYGPEDCPRYPDLAGSTCSGPPVADGGSSPDPVADPVADPLAVPDAAEWIMLGPLVRGTEGATR